MRIISLLLAVSSLSAFSQSATAPTFEVVSVRPLALDERFGPEFGCSPGGRFISTQTLRALLLWAYDLKPYQLVGVPQWDPTILRDAKGLFRIEAKAAESVTEGECKLMVQSLLADRYQMVAHREKSEMPVFALVVGKNGLKAQRVAESDNTPGVNVKINGNPLGMAAGASPQQRPSGWSMAFLADFLAIAGLGRPVVDQTGLDGVFRINLNFSMSYPQRPDYVPPEGAGPEIETALQEQMGLRLQATKASIEKLVIDRIETPTPNW